MADRFLPLRKDKTLQTYMVLLYLYRNVEADRLKEKALNLGVCVQVHYFPTVL